MKKTINPNFKRSRMVDEEAEEVEEEVEEVETEEAEEETV